MADITTSPKDSFRPSMLIYDTRYRSLTIQVVFMFLLMAGATWLVNNTIYNLHVLGKDFSYSFLWSRAGYDINQHFIAYNNDDTHARAMLVGLLNTLFIALISCAAATVLGVIAGVLRLSKNWVVAKLMSIYIEAFRNIPLLIWILVIFAVLTEAAPSPNEFRGDNPKASMWFFHTVAVTNRGVYVPEPLFSRSLGNIDLGIFLVSTDLLAIVAVLVLSILAYKRVQRGAEKIQNATGIRPVTWWKSALILIVPVIALLIALGFHFGYPELKGFNFRGGIHARNSLIALWVALSIYTGAFIAEIVRAGIQAIARGQSEASLALGLRPGQTMNLVILPQALRVIIPPMISEYLNITKNTSLAIAVGYMDLRATLGGITLNQTGRELEAMLLMMGIYLVISLCISGVMNVYNSRVKLKER